MSRQSWTWCPEAKAELPSFQEADKFLRSVLAAKLTIATTTANRRPGERAAGRVRRLAVITSITYWVLFVERRDGRGLGGLLLHRCEEGECNPPAGGYEVAAYRLSGMSGW